MSLDLLRVIVDFGLLILIWIVQTIIYPSFTYYSQDRLIEWHKRYTPAIAKIVGPLMIVQLGIAVYQIINNATLFSIVYLLLVLSIWALTFFIFVPLHGNISKERFRESIPHTLVSKNWSRTLLWTLIFILSLLQVVL